MSATDTERSVPAIPRLPSPRPVNPWKGLHYYTEQDRGIFFGRYQETEAFLRLVQRDTLSVLFARSGLGKTSLLRAGVIPRLHEEGFLPVIVRVDYAASALPPPRQIMDAMLAAAAVAGLDVENIGESGSAFILADGQETLWEFFHRHQFWGSRNDLVVPVLILDQFEEGFTLGRHSPDTAEFHTQLADLVENRMPQRVQRRLEATGERTGFDTRAQHYRVILSLREDFVPKLDALRPIMPAVMRNRFALAPLDREHGVEVIRRAGHQWVSEAVAQEIVAVVAGESQTPEQQPRASALGIEIEPAYLSVMCHELFQRMTDLGRTEIGSDLVAAEHGHILDALYERSFEGLAPKTRLFIEDRLLTASGFRGTVPEADTRGEGIPMADLETLVDRRLLRFEDRLGTKHVELSHDLLTRVVQKSRDKRRAEAAREMERQREKKLRAKLRRTRFQALAGVVVVILLLGAIVFSAFGWWIPHYSYSRTFTKQWGGGHPVEPLPKSAVSHRSWTLRLTSQGWFGKVHRVEVIDANRQLTAKHGIRTYLEERGATKGPREKESQYEFVYDDSGHVVYEVARDRFGHMTWGFVYAPQARPAVSLPPSIQVIHWLKQHIGGEDTGEHSESANGTFLGPDGYPLPRGHSRAEFVKIHYDERGFEDELRYFDRERRPMPGPEDTYGQRREYDEEGRVIRLASLNARGEPMNDADGKATVTIEYDRDRNLIEARTLDAEDEPTLSKRGYHRASLKDDLWGRITELRFFDLEDKPAIDTKTAVHRVTADYDAQGNVKSIRLYGQANESIVPRESSFEFEFPAHERRATFDQRNRLKTVAYFDQQSNPITGPEGWHSYRLEYDERGVVFATNFLNPGDHPVNQKTTGAHRMERKNDTFGQPIEERFFDTERNPIATRDGGYHLRKNRYDPAGNLEEQTYFGIDDAPVADRPNGAHQVFMGFDRFGHPRSTKYFDEAGKPINNTQGFHRVESTYDDYSLERSRCWYDKDGRPCNGPDGVHCINYENDDRGLRTRVTRYNVDNQPAAGRDGIYEMLYDYNDTRQQTKRQFFGLDGKPVEDQQGNHLVITEFDERGRERKVIRRRADGSLN